MRLNSILNMVVRCNQALVRTEDEEELIKGITEILQKEGFISRITGERQKDIAGYKTHLTFPLELDNISLGYFEIFSNESLSDLEYIVLKDLADDIVYGIISLRNRRALEVSEKRYKAIFENTPIALLEEDCSSIKRFIDKLKSLGITDIEKYLDEHGEEVLECLNNIIITDVNNACIRLYNAKTKEDLIGPLGKVIGRESIRIGKDLIISIYKKGVEFGGENINYTLDGKPIVVYTKTFILPGYEDTLEKVIVSLVDITEQRRLENELKKTLKEIIEAFSRLVELRDPHVAGHQERVAKLAYEIGKRLKLKEDDLEELKIAGLLHDIGKIIIPGEILNKPGKLNDFEFSIVKLHPKTGYDILREVDSLSNVAQIILQHHERLNGSGYPNGLRDGDILLSARIIAVADVADAMSSHRPYRPAYKLEDVIGELEKGKGILYDSDVVNICRRILEEGFSFKL